MAFSPSEKSKALSRLKVLEEKVEMLEARLAPAKAIIKKIKNGLNEEIQPENRKPSKMSKTAK